MYQEGYLSIWLGNADSREALENYVCLRYSEDGDLIPSSLMKDFALVDEDGDYNDYDEGCREIAYFRNSLHAQASLFTNFSYSDQVTEKVLTKLSGKSNAEINAVVVLYNYHALIPENKISGSNGVRLIYHGAFEYKM